MVSELAGRPPRWKEKVRVHPYRTRWCWCSLRSDLPFGFPFAVCRSGRGRRGVRPAVAGVGQRGDAREGDAQHHDQAPRGVPLVAEERGQHAAGLAAGDHPAHLALCRRR